MRRGIFRSTNRFLALGVLLVVGILVWRAATAHDNPSPTGAHLTRTATIADTAVLREGLAATGLVLIMSRFPRSRMKRELVGGAGALSVAAWRGLILLEVVIFPQSIRIQVGSGVIASGALLGLLLTTMMALFTFTVHRRLPEHEDAARHRRVFGVMAGKQAQEMRLAGWTGYHHPARTPPGVAGGQVLGLRRWLSPATPTGDGRRSPRPAWYGCDLPGMGAMP